MERDLYNDPEQEDSTRYWKLLRRKKKDGEKLKHRYCGTTEETGIFLYRRDARNT
jgi:hypothetical protein